MIVNAVSSHSTFPASSIVQSNRRSAVVYSGVRIPAKSEICVEIISVPSVLLSNSAVLNILIVQKIKWRGRVLANSPHTPRLRKRSRKHFIPLAAPVLYSLRESSSSSAIFRLVFEAWAETCPWVRGGPKNHMTSEPNF